MIARSLLVMLATLFALGCGPEDNRKRAPSGTPTDPVEVCERLADVCRYQSSQLGVCMQSPEEPTKMVCVPQH